MLRSISLIVVINGFLLIWLILKPGSLHFYVSVETIIIALCPLLMLPYCFSDLPNAFRHDKRQIDAFPALRLLGWVPILLGLAIISQSIGESFFVYYYQFFNQAPFPSLEDAAYLSAYPTLLLAILLITRRRLPLAARLRILLDGLIVLAGIFTFSWYFILGPTVLAGGATIFAQVVGDAYPLGDLLLICCLILLATRSRDPALRPVVIILSLGLIANIFADSTYDYRLLQTGTSLGAITDVGWSLGYMLYGMGAQVLHQIMTRQVSPGEEQTQDPILNMPQGWIAWMPYVLVPAVGALYVYTQYTPSNSALKNGVFLGGVVLIGLVLVRQYFAVRETIFSNKKLRSVQQELRTNNHALSEANTQLEQQAKQQRHLNDLKDQFLLNVNHELRTPLTEIQGYLDLLQEFGEQLDVTTQTKFLNHASRGCEELQRLINNVLDTIQGNLQNKVPHYGELALITVVSEALDIFEPKKRQDYHIELEIPQDLIVRADQQYLTQILLNLLSNAFKYSPPQTTVIVSATVCDTSIQEADGTPRVTICVQDTGPGIPPSEIPVLFEKFVRLKRDLAGSVRGTGLGLYICKQLVEAMGGHIWVESSGIPGLGSRFCFTLPHPSKEIRQDATLVMHQARDAPFPP